MTNKNVERAETQEPIKARKAWRRRSWKEMSSAQRVTNIVLALVECVLTGWALWDIRKRPADQINGKKRPWVMASLIQPIGPIIYFFFGRKRESMHLAA